MVSSHGLCLLLGGRQQVEEQRCQTCIAEDASDVAVARAVPAAATAVREDDDAARALWQAERGAERDARRRYIDGTLESVIQAARGHVSSAERARRSCTSSS